MSSTVVFWSMFGAAVRWWQMGLEMRPFFHRNNVWTYPLYMTGFGFFGYWLKGVEDGQKASLEERKQELLQKRARWQEKQANQQASP